MTAEWISAVATAGTFVVILASAIAALVQLRHMRGSNQIVALTECRETMESARVRRRARVRLVRATEAPQRPRRSRAPVGDPIRRRVSRHRNGRKFFESMGVFVKNGIIDKDNRLRRLVGVVLRNWEALAADRRIPARAKRARLCGRILNTWPCWHRNFSSSTRVRNPLGFPRMPKDRTLVESRAESSTP